MLIHAEVLLPQGEVFKSEKVRIMSKDTYGNILVPLIKTHF